MVQFRKKESKKGSLLVGETPIATELELIILRLISKEFLTIKQIARNRKTTDRAVYKIVKNLKKKGLLNAANKMTISEGNLNILKKKKQKRIKAHGSITRKKAHGTGKLSKKKEPKKQKQPIVNQHRQPVNHHRQTCEHSKEQSKKKTKPDQKALGRKTTKSKQQISIGKGNLNSVKKLKQDRAALKHQIRLHGQQFNVIILYKDANYKKRIGTTINIDGNTIKCHREVIDIYGTQSFFGSDPQEATAKSLEYWGQFFIRIENDLHITLVKPRAQNIRQVKAHYSECDNELAHDAEEKEYKVYIKTTDDKKLWFTIDNSFSLREAEAQHPETSKGDMEKVQSFFNDIRDNNPVILTDFVRALEQLAALTVESMKDNKDTAKKLNMLSGIVLQQTTAQEQPKTEKKEEIKEKSIMYG